MMKNKTLIFLFFLLSPLVAFCQPSGVKNVAKSIFTLTTFKQDGTVLATSHGFFVGSNGEAVGQLSPFIGAERAVVVDFKGNKMDVERIFGVNSVYDVAGFRVKGRTTPVVLAQNALPSGSEAWLVGMENKQAVAQKAIVKNQEKIMQRYAYYTMAVEAQDNLEACPFVNASGEVIGLMQRSKTSGEVFATDVRYINQLEITGLSLNEDQVKKIGIPMALPKDENQAILALVMASTSTSKAKYEAAVSDFREEHPTLMDGYSARAQMLVEAKEFQKADDEMQLALKQVAKKDEAHFAYAKLVFNKEAYMPQEAFAPWSLDKAISEVDEANKINPQPLYTQYKASIIFAKGEYAKAYELFMGLLGTNVYAADVYYDAARCKIAMNAPAEECLCLLDSAINKADTLNYQGAAPYYYARAEVYESMKSYRNAVLDYTRYEVLSGKRQPAAFYYQREQVEVKARLYKQAIMDINSAILLSPQEPTYMAERASLLLRLNELDEARRTAEACIKQAPDYSDGYLVLGLVQIRKDQKAEGMKNLMKADELGNPQAKGFIEKYK